MIEESARVVAAEEGYAWVETQRRSACSACSVNKGCGTSVLGKVLGRRQSLLKVLDPVGVAPGDEVVVGLQETALVRGALAVYLVPLLAMILAALGGERLLPPGPAGEAGAVVAGLAGLAAGLLWVRRYARRVSADPRFQPVILRRLGPVYHSGHGVLAP